VRAVVARETNEGDEHGSTGGTEETSPARGRELKRQGRIS
jgi:hypothetical protein